MPKLTWLGTISLTITACLATTLRAQTSYQNEYVGPLDAIQSQETLTAETSSLANVVANDSGQRLAKLVAPTKILPFKAFSHRLNTQSITEQVLLSAPPAPRTPPTAGNINRTRATQVPKRIPVQAIQGEALPIDNAPRVFAEPITDNRLFPVAAEPASPGYIIPAPQDPTRFGYQDGQAFGFNNTRLYHPLEGPTLNLQGAPTYDFGPPGCDEWAGFDRHKNLEHQTACGGLKANPGHLGIPWLGSNENCDQTTSLPKLFPLKKRSCDCEKCQVQENYDSGCSTCSAGQRK